MSILGLDIGGANIKAADAAGRTLSRSFAMWKHPERLTDELASILHSFPQTERIAVAMTAELADCFATKAEGVRFILDAVEASAPPSSVEVWTTAGRFVTAKDAASQPMLVAAANWQALATWCGRTLLDGGPCAEPKAPLTLTLSPEDGGGGTRSETASSQGAAGASSASLVTRHSSLATSALLIDIGTTTTDIIPLVGGRPVARGLTDVGRLQSGELSYSGVKRTPLCAIAQAVPVGQVSNLPVRGRSQTSAESQAGWKPASQGDCPLAAELFATTLDVYLLLGDIAEDPADLETANGKPATKAAAHDRIARMLCCDRDEVSFDEAVQIAKFLADVQRQRLAGSLERVASRFETPVETVIVSGSGSFLARRLVAENRRTSQAKIVSLDEQLSPGIAEAACAYAVAQLLAGSATQCGK